MLLSLQNWFIFYRNFSPKTTMTMRKVQVIEAAVAAVSVAAADVVGAVSEAVAVATQEEEGKIICCEL